MTTYSSGNRRRNYFIKKEFQARFISRFVIPVILTALISALVVYYFSNQSVTTVFENSRLVIKPGTEFIMPGLILSTLVSVILVGIATMFVMFFISHRIAGPLHKVERSLKKMGNGDLSFDVYFRRRDEIKKLAETFNVASQRLNALVGDVKLQTGELNSAVNEMRTLPQKSLQEQDASIKRLEIILAQLNEKLLKFRLR